MKKELLTQKTTELNNMLQKAHKMLMDIGVPVAPLDCISVTVNPNTRKRISAECIEEADGRFLILFHAYSVYEPEINGEKFWTFSGLLHELVHTCYNETEYGIWSHDNLFLKYAKKIQSAYGYNLLSAIQPEDYPYITETPLHSIICPDCGSMMYFYSDQTWAKYETIQNEHKPVLCAYCRKNHLVFK